MTAALVAATQGLRVVLCEATSQVGGTTATSAGTLWAPGNRHAAAAGHADSVAEAARYLEALIGPDDERGLRQVFLESVGPAIDWLERNTEVTFTSSGMHPDYKVAPGAALSGRAVSPLPFDGRLLGNDFQRVRAPLPSLMVLGGMMLGKADVRALTGRYSSIANFLHTLRLVARHAMDRLGHPRGTRLVMGNALVARLFFSLRQAGVDIRFGWRLTGLDRDDGQVRSARFQLDEGGESALTTRVGVVMATGGVGHHAALRRELGPEGFEFHSLAAEGVRGGGLEAARAAGAKLEQHRENFLWQPVSVVPSHRGTPLQLFPHLYLDRAKPGLIAINAHGERFVDEAQSYHHFVEGMLHGQARSPTVPTWLICDADFVRRYGLGVIPPGTRRLGPWQARGYVAIAPTLAALADKIGVAADSLCATVTRFNEFARESRDGDFGKGDTVFDRFNGDPQAAGNPCLGVIGASPFCALAIWPADAASSGGLATDSDDRVLDGGGIPIPGLYACGNDAASVMRGQYPGPGATLGPAIAAGWRIGRHARVALAGLLEAPA